MKKLLMLVVFSTTFTTSFAFALSPLDCVVKCLDAGVDSPTCAYICGD